MMPYWKGRIKRLAGVGRSPFDRIMASGEPSRRNDGEGPRILCATSIGGHPLAPEVDSLVAAGLWLRGARPEMLLCDGVLAACEACVYGSFSGPEEFSKHGPQRRLCGGCFDRGASLYAPLPTPVHRYSAFLKPGMPDAAMRETAEMSLEECFTFEREGLALGRHAWSSTLRFFGKGDLRTEPPEVALTTARRYAAGALLTAAATEAVFRDLAPACVVTHHGIYVPQGVIGEVARRERVRVVTWSAGYRDSSLIFSHDDSYHFTLLDEPRSLWDRPLSTGQDQSLAHLLAERRRGRGDWNWIWDGTGTREESSERRSLLNRLGLDPERPIHGLLTNIVWDAQLYYGGMVFADMLEWLRITLDHFQTDPSKQLIVRIHPHESRAGNREPLEPWLRANYPELKPNIKIVSHDSPLNTYELMALCTSVLIYGTKTGVELAPLGTPVIVSADAWIRGKGFTYDITSKKQYEDLLGRLSNLKRLDSEATQLARRYAYHYFFRRMIPIASIDASGGLPPRLRPTQLSDIMPGRDPGLDVVCEGILDGHEFVFEPDREFVASGQTVDSR